jgi:acetolactate synthase I/III small subunit
VREQVRETSATVRSRVSPFANVLCCKTGLMALPRSPLYAPVELAQAEAEDVVDHSALPPS